MIWVVLYLVMIGVAVAALVCVADDAEDHVEAIMLLAIVWPITFLFGVGAFIGTFVVSLFAVEE